VRDMAHVASTGESVGWIVSSGIGRSPPSASSTGRSSRFFDVLPLSCPLNKEEEPLGEASIRENDHKDNTRV
jgi:hypothetical protein